MNASTHANINAQIRLLMPVQALPKSLPRSGLKVEDRMRLAYAFAGDTLAAIRGCDAIYDVVIVSPDLAIKPLADEFEANFIQSTAQAGLDAALDAAHAATRGGSTEVVVALTSDLPALRADELQPVLVEAAQRRRRALYVPDLSGVGVTLQAEPAWAFSACLERDPISRLRRRGTAVDRMIGGLRCDVDTGSALRVARFLGLGTRTQMELGKLGDRALRPVVVS